MTEKKLPLHERFRELTAEEINNLSLEMKCAWFYAPWNISMDATTVEEWAERVGAYRVNGDLLEFEDMTQEEAIRIAIIAVEDLIEFVRKIKFDLKFKVRP